VLSTTDSVDLRGTGAFHHILTLRRTPHAGVIRIVLDAADRVTTDGLYGQVRGVGGTVDGPPRVLSWSGGGYGFGCKDPEGRSYAVVSDVTDHAEAADRADRPRKISHINLNCAGADRRVKRAQTLFRCSNDGYRLER
jgi:hypothetical protein